MREPPDQKRKTPPQHHPRQGQIRKQHHPNRSKALHSGQLPAYLPRRGSKSLQAVARQLRDDGLAPIGVRVSGGSFAEVALRDAEGAAVEGTLSDDRTSWTASQPLHYALMASRRSGCGPSPSRLRIA